MLTRQIGGAPRRAPHQCGPDPIILAYGAGLDSTAMLIGLGDRHVAPDLILFTNIGSETRETIA